MEHTYRENYSRRVKYIWLKISPVYIIQKRDADYDEYLLQQAPKVIKLLNFGGKLTFFCNSLKKLSETKTKSTGKVM